MRPFGQACRSCDTDFILPGFSDKVASEALLRLFHKIRKNCYGKVDDGDGDNRDTGGKAQRHGKPHEAALCEACSLGVCGQGEDGDDDDR